MESEFWLNVWENGNLNFHSNRTNPFLMKFWPQLGVKNGGSAFVPLCGKSVDMLWLTEQGHPVIGVELSSLAAEAFFSENAVESKVEAADPFTVWHGGDVALHIGDFFNLTADHLINVRGVFDRAAIVALPEPMRRDYAEHLANILSAGTKILLLAFEYEQAQKPGPPYSVSSAEVEQIFSPAFSVQKLDQRELIEKAPGMKRVGLTSFEQHTYLLEKLD